MSCVRNAAGIAAAFVLAAVHARGPSPAAPASSATTDAPPPAAGDAEESRWSFSVSAYTYVVPDDHDFVQPTVTADRGRLHLEARYNYEALETGSAWVGYNFSGGEALAWEFTPMIGGVVGDTTGLAPGCKGSLGWWKLELYSEDEYVFDTGDSSGSFFYAWSELSLAPVDWGRFGLAGQRTRVYQTDHDIQRGVLVGVTYKGVELTSYVFDPDTSEPTVVVAVGVTF
jgi:hypothetical protein